MRNREAFALANELVRDIKPRNHVRRVQTLGKIEVETKIDMACKNDIRLIIRRILEIADGIQDTKVRTQRQVVFADDATAYHTLIYREQDKELHARSKTGGELIMAPSGTPIFVRAEKKMRPGQDTHAEDIIQIASMKQIGSFEKQCVDLSFRWKGLLFTGTVSLVRNSVTGAESQQYELEFDGHKKKSHAPPAKRIIRGMDEVSGKIFEGYQRSVLTKLEWLVGENGPQEVLPKNTPITLEQSKLLRQYRKKD
jgi:hypothetical protein